MAGVLAAFASFQAVLQVSDSPLQSALYSVAALLLVGWCVRFLISAAYRPWAKADSEALPIVSVVVPCYNEGPHVQDTITSILDSQYPAEKLELIAIDDGSGDDTAAWIEHAISEIDRDITFIRFTANHGKRCALRAGFRRARGEIVVTTDSDCRLEPDTLCNLIAPLIRDRAIAAVAGCVRPDRRQPGWIPRLLEAPFAISFDCDRTVQSRLGSVLCVPGAAAAYRKASLFAVLDDWCPPDASYNTRRVGEDRELTNRLLLAGWRAVYQRSAVVQTRIPRTIAGLAKVFLRWGRGDVRETWRHLTQVFSRRRKPGFMLLAGYVGFRVFEQLALYTGIAGATATASLGFNGIAIVLLGIAAGMLPPMLWLWVQRGWLAAVKLLAYTTLWLPACSWIGPAAAVTCNNRRWLSRKAAGPARRSRLHNIEQTTPRSARYRGRSITCDALTSGEMA